MIKFLVRVFEEEGSSPTLTFMEESMVLPSIGHTFIVEQGIPREFGQFKVSNIIFVSKIEKKRNGMEIYVDLMRDHYA